MQITINTYDFISSLFIVFYCVFYFIVPACTMLCLNVIGYPPVCIISAILYIMCVLVIKTFRVVVLTIHVYLCQWDINRGGQ